MSVYVHVVRKCMYVCAELLIKKPKYIPICSTLFIYEKNFKCLSPTIWKNGYLPSVINLVVREITRQDLNG